MPSKNSVKQFVENGIYHVYNRGNEKKNIFEKEQDYGYFLGLIKSLLNPNDETSPDLSKEVEVLGYCLMPNHFHLIIRQKTVDGMTKFLKSLSTRYSMYFNLRTKRVGRLYQDVYKAVLVQTDEQLMHLSRYVHLNSNKLRKRFTAYPYSSYKYYSGKAEADWINPDAVLELFDSSKDYEKFMLSSADSKTELGRVAID